MARTRGCVAPELYETVTDYCFGHVDSDVRATVEAHLRVCPVCQRDVAKLKRAVEVLRYDRELMPPVAPGDVAGAFGLSARLHEPFGGHLWLVLLGCALYAGLYTATLWMEVGLKLNLYLSQVLLGSPFVFVLIFATAYPVLKLCWRRVVRDAGYTLTICFVVLLLAALGAYGLSWVFLPQVAVNGAATPQQIFLVSACRFLALFFICLVIPFHFVVTMQRELAEGNHAAVLKALARDKAGVLPRGLIYLRIGAVLPLLTILSVLIWWGQREFVRLIAPGGYRDFYVTLSSLVWLSYFAFGTGLMLWYFRMINELKRECLVAEAFLRR